MTTDNGQQTTVFATKKYPSAGFRLAEVFLCTKQESTENIGKCEEFIVNLCDF